MHLQNILLSVIMLRFHFFTAKQGTWVHKDDRGPSCIFHSFRCNISSLLIMTRDHILTWNYDPGSQFNVKLWPLVKIPRWIMTPGYNSTFNCDPNPGSQFNVESWLVVKIQCGIKTWGHNSTWTKTWGSQFNGVQILTVGGVVI